MAELTSADVAVFTDGRLPDDADTQRILDAALVMARRHTGWHVSPVLTDDEVVIDGPDSRILHLPTRRLDTLTSVTEDGTALDLANLSWSAGGPPGLLERPVAVRKRGGRFWSAEYQAIEVVMTHGYTEAEAADWRWAVLSMVDQMSLVPIGSTAINESMLTRKTVDDVTYQWANPLMATAEEALYKMDYIFCDYKLPRVEFL